MNCGQEDTLNCRLAVFVTCFVQYVENSIESHIATATVGNKLKIGEVGSAFLGFASDEPATWVKSAATLYELMSEDAKKKKSRVVKDAFRFVPKDIRVPIFVEAAGAVFMSYEQIFMAVSGAKNAESGSWTFGIEKLAADAAERFCNQVIKDKELQFSAREIITAVRKGDSKDSSLISQVLPNCNYIWWSKSGHIILIKGENGESTEWKTSDVFGKAGVVEITDEGLFEKIYGDKATHYRRRLKWESLEGLGLKDKRTTDINTKKYKYKLKMETLSKQLKAILEFIFSQNCDLRDLQILKELKELRKTVEALADKIEKNETALLSSSEETTMSSEVSELSINEIDTNLPKPIPIYISRSISNRLQLNPDVFKEKGSEVFVFQSVDRFDLVRLVEPHVTRSSSTQLTGITSTRIYLDNEEDWNDLIAISEAPVHLVCKENNEYILQRSTKVMDIILQYSSNKGRTDNVYVSESDFVDQLLSNTDWKGALLCDIPGMGKTMLMGSLARKLQDKDKNISVLFITLSTFSKSLAQLDTPPESDEAIKYVIQQACPSKSVSALLFQHFKKGRKFVIFFDGFDEIPDDHESETSLFLTNINKIENIGLIISSRPHMRRQLEKTFSLISYDILPFTREEQIRSMVGHWLGTDSGPSNQMLIDFAGSCIHSIKNILQSDTHGILGVPLQCYLLAIVNERYAQKLLLPGRNQSYIGEVATVKSTCELYERFVEAALKKGSTSIGIKDSSQFNERILEFHTIKALELLFPEISSIYPKPLTVSHTDVARMGILCAYESAKFTFVHRTFAEYFVGRFFANFWTNNSSFGRNIVEQVGTCFWNIAMKTSAKKFLVKLDKLLEPVDRLFVPQKREKYWEFKYERVLFFMNGYYKVPTDIVEQTNPLVIFKRTLWNPVWDWLDVLQIRKFAKFKCHFRTEFYTVVLACLEAGYTNIMLLTVEIIKLFFTMKERPQLLHPPLENFEMFYIDKSCNVPLSTCFLLIQTALAGVPEDADALFDIFRPSSNVGTGNHLLRLCYNWPTEYLTPVEISIANNNVDMFAYFFNKMNVTWERLFVRCMIGTSIGEVDAKNKALIFHRVTKGNIEHADELVAAFNEYFTPSIKDSPKDSWISFGYKHNTRLNGLSRANKQYIIEKAMASVIEEDFIKLLVLLFGKRGCEYPTEFKAEKFLKCIDLPEAKGTCQRWNQISCIHWSFFSGMNSLETLNVLIGICQHLFSTDMSDQSEDYMEICVHRGSLNCVNYLIRSGYNVNKCGQYNKTPLHWLSRKRTVEITRTLISNGASILATTSSNDSVAHSLLRYAAGRKFDETDYLSEWVDYTLEMKPEIYKELWSIMNKERKTSLDMLEEVLGSTHRATMAVKRKIFSYS